MSPAVVEHIAAAYPERAADVLGSLLVHAQGGILSAPTRKVSGLRRSTHSFSRCSKTCSASLHNSRYMELAAGTPEDIASSDAR
jgi:hypothetical protein